MEEEVYKELEAISVLGAMDTTMYQRGEIEGESMYYEHKKHDGSLSLIGGSTFLPKDHGGEIAIEIELIRSTEGDKRAQIGNVKRYGEARNALVADSLKTLQSTARNRENVFEQLMEALKYSSLGTFPMRCMRWVGSIGGTCDVDSRASSARVAPTTSLWNAANQ